MRINSIKIISLLAGSVLFLAGAGLKAQTRTEYEYGELKQEQEKFKAYLCTATNELRDAKHRLFDRHTCDLATAATVAALAEKDASRISQKGHLERVARVKGGFMVSGVSHSKWLNDHYVPIRTFCNETEDSINDFINGSLAKYCQDYMWLITAYRDALKKIENDPNAADKLEQIQTDMRDMIAHGKVDQSGLGRTLTGLDPVSRFLANPADAQAREDFIRNMMDKGMSRQDAEALADAIARGDWAKVRDILSRNPGQAANDLWTRLKDKVGSNWQPLAAGGMGTGTSAGPGTGTSAAGPGTGTSAGPGTGTSTGPGAGTTAGPGTGTTVPVSEEEVDISGWPDWKGDKCGPKVRAFYPMGRANGTLGRETEMWRQKVGDQINETSQSFEWELIIKSDDSQKGKEVFWVENKAKDQRDFSIEGWEVLLNGRSVQTAQDPKCTVTYTEAGKYEIVASGKTKPNNVPFKARETRTYSP